MRAILRHYAFRSVKEFFECPSWQDKDPALLNVTDKDSEWRAHMRQLPVVLALYLCIDQPGVHKEGELRWSGPVGASDCGFTLFISNK